MTNLSRHVYKGLLQPYVCGILRIRCQGLCQVIQDSRACVYLGLTCSLFGGREDETYKFGCGS